MLFLPMPSRSYPALRTMCTAPDQRMAGLRPPAARRQITTGSNNRTKKQQKTWRVFPLALRTPVNTAGRAQAHLQPHSAASGAPASRLPRCFLAASSFATPATPWFCLRLWRQVPRLACDATRQQTQHCPRHGLPTPRQPDCQAASQAARLRADLETTSAQQCAWRAKALLDGLQ
eukprot:366404-Chlamydomonas_euryale.AAC.12